MKEIDPILEHVLLYRIKGCILYEMNTRFKEEKT